MLSALKSAISSRPSSVVLERSALHDDFLAELRRVFYLQNFVERVAHYGVDEARGDVLDCRALLLRLADARVHEDGAARAEVYGVARLLRGARELVHLHVERLREALEEGAAARGAGFVEEYAVDDAVLDAQTFHILSADVDDEVRARQHEARGARVRDGLDLADVDAEGRLYQLFAVAGDAARLYRDGIGHQRIELGEHLAHRLDRLADAVDFIAREEQLALRADEHDLRRRGADVDAEVGVALVGGDVHALRGALGMALLEAVELRLRAEERRQYRVLLFLMRDEEMLRALLQHVCGDRAVLLRAYRRAHRDEEVRILGEYALLGRQLQRLGEALAQLREEVERPAEEGDAPLYPAPAGEAAYRLVYYGLEYRSRDVRLRRSVVKQRLNVGLCEDAAARGDGVDCLVALRHLVEPSRVRAEERRHLVEEGPRAARAGFVHALLRARRVEEGYLRVLAAELYADVDAGQEARDARRAGYLLLRERHVHAARELQSARARHREREARAGEPVSHFVYKLADRRADVREVAAVSAENYSVVFVEDDDLRRSRAYVKSSVKKLHCIIPPDEKLRRPSLHAGRRPDAGAPVASAAARSCRLPEFICRKENL